MGNLEAVREVPGGLELRVWVQPGASRTELVGLVGDALKIRIAAPAREGRANEALLRFLAELFHVPKTSVHLRRGLTSRLKIVFIAGARLADWERIRPARG